MAKYPRDWFQDNRVIVCLTFKKLPNCFPKQVYHFYIPISIVWDFQFLYILTSTRYCHFFFFFKSFFSGYTGVLVLTCISWMINNIEHLFMYSIAIHVMHLCVCKMSVQIFCPYFKLDCLLSSYWVMSVNSHLYSGYQTFIRQVCHKYFSQSVACPFMFITVFFKEQKFYSLMKSSVDFLMDHTFGNYEIFA